MLLRNQRNMLFSQLHTPGLMVMKTVADMFFFTHQSSRQLRSCLFTTHTAYLPHRRSRTPTLLSLWLRFSTRPATQPLSEHTKVSLWCKRTPQRNAVTLCLFRSTVGIKAGGEQNRTSPKEPQHLSRCRVRVRMCPVRPFRARLQTSRVQRVFPFIIKLQEEFEERTDSLSCFLVQCSHYALSRSAFNPPSFFVVYRGTKDSPFPPRFWVEEPAHFWP